MKTTHQHRLSTLAATAGVLLAAGHALAQCPPTFTVSGPWPMATNPYSVAVADFNTDGLLDFAASGFGGSIGRRLADPNFPGTYASPTTAPVALNLRGLAVADFNHDGRPDIATGCNGAGPPPGLSIAVLLTGAGGVFGSPVTYPVTGQVYDLRVKDLNHDGNPDVIAAIANTSLAVMIGNANGTFQPPVTAVASVFPAGFTVADINGDGTYDLVSTKYNDPPQVRVALGIPGTGGTGYSAFVSYTVPAAFGPWGINTGDFNGDGRDDVVVTHRVTNRVGVLIGSADGSLTPMTTAQPGVQPQDVAVADFNADGRLDVAVANWGGNNLSVLMGDGAGGLGSRANFAMGTHPNGVVVADMNGDGKPDIVVANQDSGTISILLNTSAQFTFTQNPQTKRVCPGGTSAATFSAAAATNVAGGITAYRWERSIGGAWTTLPSGTVAGMGDVSFSGNNSSMFVTNVQGNPGDLVASVRCVSTNACGTLASNVAELRIILPCGGADVGGVGGVYTGCGDGVLDNNDFVVFIDLFFNGNALADVGSQGGVPGADGQFNNNDFVVFIDMFFNGCTI
ncbi:MAG: VCBS repeat-containing protein [Phycisphaerales bacterium]|nr:VCBS repeat-containing protein [Phycisphaerales bacterium]